MAQRIDGTAEAAKVRETVRVEAAAFTDRHDLAPGLAVVLVGDSAASQIYVKSKTRHAVEAGLRSFEHRLAEDVDEATLLELVATLNGDDAVHGILVQLPLPPQISTDRVLRAISPAKDVDGFHPENVGLLAQGQPFMVPCTPLGCLHLARTVHRELRGKEVVVVGRSTIVGRPAAQLFLQADCTVTIAHSRTADLPAVCRRADILVVAVGRPEFVRADWVKPGATVIDVGINRLPAEDGGRGRIVGDVDHAGVQGVAGAITPVPGGVGPMTVALLLANTLTCARGLTENSAGRPQR